MVFRKSLSTFMIILSFFLVQVSNIDTAEAKKKKKKKKKKAAQAKVLDKKMMSGKFKLIGVKFAGNFASISQSNEEDGVVQDPSSGFGMGFGLSFDMAVNKYVGFRAEALYQNKNISHKSPIDYKGIELVDTETWLDYLEIPVMAVVRFLPGSLIRPYVTVGFYGSILLPTNGTQEGHGQLENPRTPFSSFDSGWLLGAGSYFILPPGAGFLSAELRYSSGLANIADTSIKIEDSTATLAKQIYTMGNFAVMFGYYF